MLLDSRRVRPRAEFSPTQEERDNAAALEAVRERLAAAEATRDRIEAKIVWANKEIQRLHMELGPVRLAQEDGDKAAPAQLTELETEIAKL